jgi:hypothetical protein
MVSAARILARVPVARPRSSRCRAAARTVAHTHRASVWSASVPLARDLGRPLVQADRPTRVPPDPRPVQRPPFFPLLPILLRGLHAIGLSYSLAGLLTANAMFLVALTGLYQLVLLWLPEADARRTALIAALVPGSVVMSMIYPESIGLACIAFTGVFAARRRWLLCAVCTALAPLARPEGLLLAIPSPPAPHAPGPPSPQKHEEQPSPPRSPPRRHSPPSASTSGRRSATLSHGATQNTPGAAPSNSSASTTP